MHISTEERLRQKGWSEEEIQRAISVMSKPKQREYKSILFSESFKTFVYWTGLIIAIICNFFASAFLIPLLLILSKTFLFSIITILGLSFGFMFSILIRDLEKVDEKHHIIGGLFIPALAAINVYVMVDLSNSFNTILRLRAADLGHVFEVHNPIYISIFYVVSFVLPYAISKLMERGKNKVENKGTGGGPQQESQQTPQPYPQYPQQQYTAEPLNNT